MRAGLAAVVVAGCSFSIPAGSGQPGDGPACEAWQPQHLEPCTLVDPSAGLDLLAPGTYVYDTDARTLVDPDGAPVVHASEDQPELVVVSADHVTLGATSTLRAIGNKPLLVASWSTIVIDGAIDVSSTNGSRGAGVSSAPCAAPAPGESDIGGAAGGGGGGFGTSGGRGGDGDSNQNAGNDGISIGGDPGPAVIVPTAVRAGCRGANGGEGAPGKRGSGGAGGGAIELAAPVSIVIRGTIHAGGQGGIGVDQDGGGGGGGSGGYIGLDAPAIDIDGAVIAANGGAGAGGGDDGNVGGEGEAGSPRATAALGGIGGLPGGTRGGDGSAILTTGQAVAITDTGGGGGGGGGAGHVLVWSASWSETGATVSPPPTHDP